MDDYLESNDWKKEAPVLAGMPVHNPFSVPDGYFETLPLKITGSIYLEKLNARAAGSGFNVPENYFSELRDNINAEILTEKMKLRVHRDGYAVPKNYFEKLQSGILKKTAGGTEQAPQTKIIRLWRSSLLKYASAACFILLGAAGLYFYQLPDDSNKTAYMEQATEQILYDIDEQVIIDHIQANDLRQTSPSATDVALENYILNNYSQSDIASGL